MPTVLELALTVHGAASRSMRGAKCGSLFNNQRMMRRYGDQAYLE
jgi:hypothetical protein